MPQIPESICGQIKSTFLSYSRVSVPERGPKQNGMPSSSRIAELQSLVQQMQVEV